MGAVRIYKVPPIHRFGNEYVWAIRTDGCTIPDAYYCDYGADHDGVCNDFGEFAFVLLNLNDPHSPIGEYLNK